MSYCTFNLKFRVNFMVYEFHLNESDDENDGLKLKSKVTSINSSIHFQTNQLTRVCWLLSLSRLGSDVGKQGVEAAVLADMPFRGREHTPR
jgi:hypothetical protein